MDDIAELCNKRRAARPALRSELKSETPSRPRLCGGDARADHPGSIEGGKRERK